MSADQAEDLPVTENRRPYLKLMPHTWKAKDGTRTPGMALKYCGLVRAHLTPDEARTLADKLHDLADKQDTNQ